MLRRRRQITTRILKVGDAALFGAAFWLAHFIRSLNALDPAHLISGFDAYAWLLIVIVPAAPYLLEFQGYYRRSALAPRRQVLSQWLKASGWMAIIVIITIYLKKADGARGVLVAFIPLAVILGFTKDEILRWWAFSRPGRSEMARRVIIVGGTKHWAAMEATLQDGSIGRFEISARLDPSQTSINELPRLLHEHSVNAVLISPGQRAFSEIETAIQLCELEGVEVWLLAHFFQTRISQATVDEIGNQPVLVFRTVPEAALELLAKEFMDRLGAAVALILVSPILIFAAVAVRLTSPGPVLFRQMRAGLNGRPFVMLKFRTMVNNAEQLKQELAALNEMKGPVFKVTNDPRITRIGTFLRKWSIDEFPQLWNVLRGEMSLVGPRPLPVDEVARFDDPGHRRRLSVKPGLTCLWQVSGRNNVRDFSEWVRLDLEYIDNWSIWLDFRILLRTIPAVLSGAGAK
ncbi:MAG TPA: sugar transferase [Candidatus Limnocylindria bacterium]|jgi:exopolysaccharide biosynthesis polyprenyl glycosylphosphotransferase|nr:sugar transferase [Candidatus Limnocylindria bacterium]